jgi:predicted RNase H-like HicB family nuclease
MWVLYLVRGAHTQAATLDELQHNLKEVLELIVNVKLFPEQPIEPVDR